MWKKNKNNEKWPCVFVLLFSVIHKIDCKEIRDDEPVKQNTTGWSCDVWSLISVQAPKSVYSSSIAPLTGQENELQIY